jgi:N4-(beta-N-acetylglucosaminyl)-L-asparaginase
MMRFLPSFLAVELLRNGHTPQQAADMVIARIGQFYPENSAAVVVLDLEGNVGAACQIFSSFPVSIYHAELDDVRVVVTTCRQMGETTTPDGSCGLGGARILIIFVGLFLMIFMK